MRRPVPLLKIIMDLIDACRRGPVADANGQFGQTVVNWWRMHL